MKEIGIKMCSCTNVAILRRNCGVDIRYLISLFLHEQTNSEMRRLNIGCHERACNLVDSEPSKIGNLKILHSISYEDWSDLR